jgi:hypothetical protein|tara:strand:- start:3639 stop:4172 length:534 start_codon:yes stop_codon:yes gene_type:complete
MAQYMTELQYSINLPWWQQEVSRLEGLLADSRSRLQLGKWAMTETDRITRRLKDPHFGTPFEKKALQDELAKVNTLIPKIKQGQQFHMAVVSFMETKIKAWQQIINKQKDANMLDKLNEAIDNYVQNLWLYHGQANIKEDSEDAMDDFKMFKLLLGKTPTKPKKPTRRGGKKHKKNK